MKRKRIHVAVDTTTKCNRGCRHCLTDARPDGNEHFTAEMTNELCRQLVLLGYDLISMCFTGGGEPLLNPNFSDVIAVPLGRCDMQGKFHRISFITSGILPEEETEREQLRRVLHFPTALRRRLTFILSFNKFNSTFPERIKNTLAFFIQERIWPWVQINLCISRENFETWNDLDNALNDLEISSGSQFQEFIVDFQSTAFRWIIGQSNFQNLIWSKEEAGRLVLDTHTLDVFYTVFNRHIGLNGLLISPFSFRRKGRGKNLKDREWTIQQCPAIYGNVDDLSIRANGEIMAYCGYAGQKILIGDVEDVASAIKAKRRFSASMLKMIIGDQRMIPDLCEHCMTLASENGLQLC